ncbi:MAG: hypothetical protein LC745_07405 [Planctomycetia bacterium]|nr:hypothetical protein [Planctomycetia bacterium]
MTTAERRSDAPADLGDGMKIRLLRVGPSAASEWLKRNSERNRRVVRSRVRQYAADMRSGNWKLSDQPVSFDREGRLVNGQHRLEACILAGCEFPTLVLHGLPDESMITLDGGKKRTTDDNLAMAGQEWPRGCGGTVRRIFMGMKTFAGRAYTDQEVSEFMGAHGPAVAFAHRVLPKGKIACAPVRAAVCRAKIGGADARRLEDFGRVLSTGLMIPGDEAAVLLRNNILEGDRGSGSARSALYALAESALKAFLAGSVPKKLTPATCELFPIPGEGSWDEEA